MPESTNDFYARDKLEVVSKLRKAGFDFTSGHVESSVQEVQDFVKRMNIYPSETPDKLAVSRIENDSQNGFHRIYKDKVIEKIDQKTFMNEVLYNFVPERFRNYNPK